LQIGINKYILDASALPEGAYKHIKEYNIYGKCDKDEEKDEIYRLFI